MGGKLLGRQRDYCRQMCSLWHPQKMALQRMTVGLLLSSPHLPERRRRRASHTSLKSSPPQSAAPTRTRVSSVTRALSPPRTLRRRTSSPSTRTRSRPPGPSLPLRQTRTRQTPTLVCTRVQLRSSLRSSADSRAYFSCAAARGVSSTTSVRPGETALLPSWIGICWKESSRRWRRPVHECSELKSSCLPRLLTSVRRTTMRLSGDTRQAQVQVQFRRRRRRRRHTDRHDVHGSSAPTCLYPCFTTRPA